MAVAKTTASKPAADKPTRKMLTPAERVAKAERELARLRTQAVERDSKTADKLKKAKAGYQAKIETLTTKVNEIDAQLAKLTVTGSTDVELPLDEENVA